LKIGLSLLIIGLVLFGLSSIAVVVGQSSAFVPLILIGFFLALFVGLPSTLLALSPARRGIASIGIGIAICAISVSVIFTQVAWLDIAVILSSISSLFVSSLFIIPGIILIKYQRLGRIRSIACALLALTMMWTLILLLGLSVAMNVTDFRTYFYGALLPDLALGFVLGIITTAAPDFLTDIFVD
jgi:hypothetical protein